MKRPWAASAVEASASPRGAEERVVTIMRIVLYLLVASVLGAGGGLWLYRNQSAESVLPPLDEIQAVLDADAAKGEYEGELGDFVVRNSGGERAKEAFIFGCGPNRDEGTAPVTDPAVLYNHELWSDAFGADGIGWGCGGDQIQIVNNAGPDGHGGSSPVTMIRAYIHALPMPILRDAPLDRQELIEVEGHPALIEHPLEGWPYPSANLTVIERFPDGDTPGIAVTIHFAPSSEKAIALAEELMP